MKDSGGARPKPTLMGSRILGRMDAMGIKNHAQFARDLDMDRQGLHAWLYRPLGDVKAKPLMRCAAILRTSADYLLGLSNDPAPMEKLMDDRERALLKSFRLLGPTDQARLLKNAEDWATWTDEEENKLRMPSGGGNGGLHRAARAAPAVKRVAHKRRGKR